MEALAKMGRWSFFHLDVREGRVASFEGRNGTMPLPLNVKPRYFFG
jgi:hypothetical protein